MTYLGILLACLASLGALSAQDIMIFPSGDSVTKPEQGQVVITCSAVNVPQEQDPELKWFNVVGDQITDKTGRRLYIENVGKQELKLYITNIQDADGGTYRCEGRINGNKVEKSIELLLFKDITFDSAPTPQHPRIFEDEIIECIVSGYPAPDVSWKYRGEVIQTGGRYIVEATGLRIQNITEEDNGEYQCRAEVQSDGRLDMRQITVEVHIPPKMLESPGTVEGIEKHEVSYGCRASGKPAPTWEFYKDGNQQPLSSTETRIVDADAGTIHFRPIHRDDDGEYRCVAHNDVGTDEAVGTLDVIVPPFILEYRDVTGEENQGTTISCMTEGDPPPEMVFRKVGNNYDYELGENDNGRIIVKKEDSRRATLTINNLTPTDTGNYTCSCTNTGGKHALNGTITVHYRPRFAEDHETEVYSWAGKTRNITCRSIAEPAPSFKWLQYSEMLPNNETFKIYTWDGSKESALQIHVQDHDQNWIFSTYTCEATNAYGTGTQDIKLIRATVPDEPSEVSVKEESPTMVILTVVPPENDGGVAINAYRVEYDSHVQDFKLASRVEMRIENLKPSTTYTFLVRARNEVGVGNVKELTHTTKDISAPYPLIITSDPVGLYPYEYTVRWEKPRTGGLDIEEYRIKHRTVKVNDDGAIEMPTGDYMIRYVSDDPNAPRLHYKLEGLKPETDFQVEVAARNPIGWSQANEQFVFRTAHGDGNVGEVSGVSSVMSPCWKLLLLSLLLLLVKGL